MPDFVSVTYGAGGSTRELTHELVERIQQTTKLDPIPHLTCVCHNQQEIEAILLRYGRSGIANIFALGGDRPVGMPAGESQDAFRHAIDLVKFIRRFNDSGAHPDRRGFGIGVAGFPEGHPATPNRLMEMDYFKAKVDAGADYIITQLFFDNEDFLDFCERCALAGIHIPIIAGIMPITSMGGLKRMAELAGGARFPAKLLAYLTTLPGRSRNSQAYRHPICVGAVSWSCRKWGCRYPFLYAQSIGCYAGNFRKARYFSGSEAWASKCVAEVTTCGRMFNRVLSRL